MEVGMTLSATGKHEATGHNTLSDRKMPRTEMRTRLQPSQPVPPVRLHPVKIHNLPKIVSPAETQCYTHKPLRTSDVASWERVGQKSLGNWEPEAA